MLTLPPLSVYVHIPWCARKCPYCDFNSHQSTHALPEQDYIRALAADLENELQWLQGRKIETLFFGGGTPSLFSAGAIADILVLLERDIGFSPTAEITLEANPGTAEQAKFTGYYQAGVNRLSLGIQSFNDQHLQRLGRIHDGEQAHRAIETAFAAGFKRINLDLMHGLPEQTPAQALQDLDTAITADVGHISWYQLTIEPNTQFYRHPPQLPEEDYLAEIQTRGHELLGAKGWHQYEVSAYARDHEQSRHNLNYWHFGDYIGLGAGAHGKITLPSTNQIIRRNKTRVPADYLAEPKAKQQTIAVEDRLVEFCMNALRLKDGVEQTLIEQRTGVALPEAVHAKLSQAGLLQASSSRLAATDLGYRYLDSLLSELADLAQG